MKKIFLNLSGHRLSNDALEALKSHLGLVIEHNVNFLEIPIPNVDFSDFSDVKNKLFQIINKSGILLNGENKVVLIPPGHSSLTCLIIFYLHGLLGHFPDICVLSEDKDSGKYLPVTIINGNEIRTYGREKRIDDWNS